MSPSGCQLSQLTQLTTPASPAPRSASNLLTFHFQACSRLSFSEEEHPFSLPTVPCLQPGAASIATWAPCPLAWPARAQDNSNWL